MWPSYLAKVTLLLGEGDGAGRAIRWGHAARTPRIAWTTGVVTRWVRRGSIVVTLALAVWACGQYLALPEVVPMHFDASGQPDAYGHRSTVLWVSLLFVVLTVGCAVISRHPRLFNYPVPITEDKAEAMYREGERMLVWMLVPMQVIFFGVLQAVLLTGAVTWLMWLGLGGLFLVIIVSMTRMGRVATQRRSQPH